MIYTTSNEEDYFYDMPFSHDLRNYAKKNGIRLGEFQQCNEIKYTKEPSSYLVSFIRVREEGFYEKVSVTVQETENGFHYSIYAEPVS